MVHPSLMKMRNKAGVIPEESSEVKRILTKRSVS